jgi:hypothetical protein
VITSEKPTTMMLLTKYSPIDAVVQALTKLAQ